MNTFEHLADDELRLLDEEKRTRLHDLMHRKQRAPGRARQRRRDLEEEMSLIASELADRGLGLRRAIG